MARNFGSGLLNFVGGGFGRGRRRRASPTETVGVPGVPIYGGYAQERETNRELASHEARYRVYANILSNTSIVASGVRYFANLLGKANWTFTPSEADADGFYAKLAEAMLTGDPETPWHRVVRRAGMYRFYGFSVQEWTARRRKDDGLMTLADIEARSQTTIRRWHREDGKLLGAIQEDPQSYRSLYLPRDKVLYLVDDTLSDSPEGFGLFRHLVEPAKRLQRYEYLEGIGFELDLRGVPRALVPLQELYELVNEGRLTEAQMEAMIAPIRQFLADHVRSPKQGLMMDSMAYQGQAEAARPSNIRKWELELLKGGSTGFAENAAAIERLNRELARILGVEQLLLGADSKGSYSLSRDKTHQFYLLVDGALTEIREAVEKDLVSTLWRLNGWPDEMKPKVATEAVRFTDVEAIAKILRDMATAGVVLEPDDPAIIELFAMLGLPAPESTVETGLDDDDDDDMLDDAA